MSVMGVLLVLFILCMSLILGKSAVYVLSGLFMNLVLFLLLLFFLNQGFSVYFVSFVYILGNSLITLAYVNGWNEKTKAAFYSMLLFLVVLGVIFIPLIQSLAVHGFPAQEMEELSVMNLDMPIRFSELSVAVLFIGVSGALIDGSMAIASATTELYHRREGNIEFMGLFESSMTVVKSILNSTINTLLFAFISSSLALIFWYQDLNIPWQEMIHSKAFVDELAIILLSGVGVAVILPFTSVVTCWYLLKQKTR
ncbi:YibE/F family protein [Enterococcus saccharolyticus]|uniref:YibE/F family protein n=1 Tax=Enterococcus saccharolyticus TaxID=41997 RepID=UPI0039E16584